jgi:RimJ/RimL family protein N-acetyltransferase
MSSAYLQLRTPRLLLRRLEPRDLEPIAQLNADPQVMRFFPSPLTRQGSDALADLAMAHFEEHGFGPMAIELEGQCIGLAGLYRTSFAPWIEILWRLAAQHHNRGYATEAAKAILDDGFSRLQIEEIVAFTVPGNLASRRVMEKLGMVFDSEFEHPNLPEGHPLRRHVLYRVRQCKNASEHHRLV